MIGLVKYMYKLVRTELGILDKNKTIEPNKIN